MQAQQSAAQYGIMYAGLVTVMLPKTLVYICVQNKLFTGNDCWWFKGLMRREIKMEFWKKHTKCRII